MQQQEKSAFQQRKLRKQETLAFIECEQIINYLSIGKLQRTLQQLKFINYVFEKRVPYFQQKNIKEKLSEEVMLKLTNCLELENYPGHTILFNQGDPGRKMYFILKGEVSIFVKISEDSIPKQQPKQQIVKKLKRTFKDIIQEKFSNFRQVATKGQFDYFGEIALEQLVPRTATVITKQDTWLAVLSYDVFKKFVQEVKRQNAQIHLEFVKNIYPFCDLNQSQLLSLMHNADEVQYFTNTLIYKQPQEFEFIYLIEKGDILLQKWETIENLADNLQIKQKLTNIGLYSVGQLIGEYEIMMQSSKRISQAYVKDSVTLLRIHLISFLDMMKYSKKVYDKFIIHLNQKYRNLYQNQYSILLPEVKSLSQTDDLKTQYLQKYKRTQFKLNKMNNLLDYIEKRNTGEPEISLFDKIDPKNVVRLRIKFQSIEASTEKSIGRISYNCSVNSLVEQLRKKVSQTKLKTERNEDLFIQTGNLTTKSNLYHSQRRLDKRNQDRIFRNKTEINNY